MEVGIGLTPPTSVSTKFPHFPFFRFESVPKCISYDHTPPPPSNYLKSELSKWNPSRAVWKSRRFAVADTVASRQNVSDHGDDDDIGVGDNGNDYNDDVDEDHGDL